MIGNELGYIKLEGLSKASKKTVQLRMDLTSTTSMHTLLNLYQLGLHCSGKMEVIDAEHFKMSPQPSSNPTSTQMGLLSF